MASVTTTASGKTTPWWRSLNKLSQEQIVAAIVVILLIVFALALPGFATPRNILGLVRSISILGILGLGMGLIVISRGIDLSEIAIMAGPWCVALIANRHGCRRSGRRSSRSSSRSPSAHQRLRGRVRRGAGAVRDAGDHVRGLWRGVLDRAGLCGLCAAERAGTVVRGPRRAVRHTDADLRVCRLRPAGHGLFLSAPRSAASSMRRATIPRPRAFPALRCGR